MSTKQYSQHTFTIPVRVQEEAGRTLRTRRPVVRRGPSGEARALAIGTTSTVLAVAGRREVLDDRFETPPRPRHAIVAGLTICWASLARRAEEALRAGLALVDLEQSVGTYEMPFASGY